MAASAAGRGHAGGYALPSGAGAGFPSAACLDRALLFAVLLLARCLLVEGDGSEEEAQPLNRDAHRRADDLGGPGIHQCSERDCTGDRFFRYISVFIIYSLALGLLCSFLYGVLGVKLRFERDPLESTMKAVSSGAALLESYDQE